VIKHSRRAAIIAASFALGLSAVGPAAHAGLLGGSDDSTAIEGIGLPLGDILGGDLLGDDLLGGLLGGDLLGGDLLGGGLGGESLLGDGLPLVGDVLGGELLGDGLPLAGVLGEDGVLGSELLGGSLELVTDITLSCDAAIPQVLRTILGDATDVVCEPFSDGVLGLLGSL
jgi:hypothetical protein